MPLTPSPRRTVSLAANGSSQSSPYTPTEHQKPSTFATNIPAHFARSASRTYRESPKSNIAKAKKTPKTLELGVSDWALTGTGTATGQTPSKNRNRKDGALRVKCTKKSIRLEAGDRFIPSRTASEGITVAGSGKLDADKPKNSSGEGSAVLANAASAFDLGGHNGPDDAANALED